uniref:Replication restart protein PriA n=1 Tax=Candidatus Kentrum sp. FM TaxID=2126340 RepID=A0A450VMV7_9GAMM|nr:MAG: primosomal protein N' (replication factor Y) (superfamily II helicase) [Candidatus Kentron sp. FM]VFJ44280.1 MAG: primosomal protein N' (replication factor Y) (superfamily II helicase) [Candidatus Kentron sp. FM]VFK06148.1 MAG: primosomal protein N' (replication factor Y) (superfamily II helicase) [Candidatus Kentron sp. FM]
MESPSVGPILRVAVPSPLRRLFDYLPPKDAGSGKQVPQGAQGAQGANTPPPPGNRQPPAGATGENGPGEDNPKENAPPQNSSPPNSPEGNDQSTPPCPALPGMRVRVPFGKSQRVGLVVAISQSSEVAPDRLKPVLAILDTEPLLPPDTMALLRWAGNYYHHPMGEVLLGALPAALRTGRRAESPGPRGWRLTAEGQGHTGAELSRAPRQAALFDLLHTHPDGIAEHQLRLTHGNCLPALRSLDKRGWITSFTAPCWERTQTRALVSPPQPEPAQRAAIDAILAAQDRFAPFLLDGVTSSGKTEVYLSVIQEAVARGRQALVLIPEIGLTPQTLARFRQRIPAPIVVLHSGLTDIERLCGWLAARNGQASVVIGTRSAAFVPLARPGIFIVDEEHDLSYKQQDRFRYSARDVAVYRAKQADVPIVLGSATPSLESLYNADLGRYRRITLPERVRGAAHPGYVVTDVRAKPFRDSLSEDLLRAIEERLLRQEQVLLFLNRRGYAPLRLCHQCGWIANCERCDARMVYHVHGGEGAPPPETEGHLRCHHCGARRPAPDHCPQCGGEALDSLWAGTQRIARALAEYFPKAGIVRVDRDSIAPKGTLEKVLADVAAGRIDILVGTQMLAKGHHFPDVTLVGIVDADGGLFGVDFRAGERMAQTVIQVAGRAGRGDRPGQVLIQTHHPDHPLLQALVYQGYHRFASMALAERREAALPPFRHLALIRAEASTRELGTAFLGQIRSLAESVAESLTQSTAESGAQSMTDSAPVGILGPVPAPMERREERYRAQLLFEARERAALHRLLSGLLPQLEGLKSARRVHWSLDVDPMEMV